MAPAWFTNPAAAQNGSGAATSVGKLGFVEVNGCPDSIIWGAGASSNGRAGGRVAVGSRGAVFGDGAAVGTLPAIRIAGAGNGLASAMRGAGGTDGCAMASLFDSRLAD